VFNFLCEQIHMLEGGEIHVYSRNQENNTSKYPDIISRIPAILKEEITSCIIDSEAVAWDTEKQQILPFQVLSTRKRKVTGYRYYLLLQILPLRFHSPANGIVEIEIML